MIFEWMIAYFHYVLILICFGCVVTELVILKRTISPNDARWLRRMDLSYFIAVLALVATGLVRLFYTGKGPSFYLSLPAFHLKLGLFLLLGILSIPPTVEFLKLKPVIQANRTVVLSDRKFKRIRVCLFAEIVLFLLIPMFATLVARGGFGAF